MSDEHRQYLTTIAKVNSLSGGMTAATSALVSMIMQLADEYPDLTSKITLEMADGTRLNYLLPVKLVRSDSPLLDRPATE